MPQNVTPKSFIDEHRFVRQRGRVFAAMPFRESHSDSLWDVIHETCSVLGLNSRRADSSSKASWITADIIEELATAQIVIADLTGNNSNVIYELGAAHFTCPNVLMLCEKSAINRLQFDYSQYRCIVFDKSRRGWKWRLHKDLTQALNELQPSIEPQILRSPLDRTIAINQAMNEFAASLVDTDAPKLIRHSGFLSILAVPPSEFETTESVDEHVRNYRKELQREFDLFHKLINEGIPLKCIIYPVNEKNPIQKETAVGRTKTLLDFVKTDHRVGKQLQFVVSPYQQKNLYIFGSYAMFEGFRYSANRGYHLTLGIKEPKAIESWTKMYDALFSELQQLALLGLVEHEGETPDDIHRDKNAAIKRSVIYSLEASLEQLQE